jgi:hypothetical protein
MLYYVPALLIAVLLFVGINLLYMVGLRVRERRSKRFPLGESGGMGPLEGALLGLLSLLLAFTFSQSASDYGTERDLLVAEANAIRAAVGRADLYPEPLRTLFRKDFKEFVAARIAYYEAGTDELRIHTALEESDRQSARIWQRAVMHAQQSGDVLRAAQMLPAITSVMDAGSRREEARIRYLPDPILWLLFLLCLIGSFIVGYANTTRRIDWMILTSYSLMTVMTIYVILDLDRPRRGIMRTAVAQENIRSLMNALEEDGK